MNRLFGAFIFRLLVELSSSSSMDPFEGDATLVAFNQPEEYESIGEPLLCADCKEALRMCECNNQIVKKRDDNNAPSDEILPPKMETTPTGKQSVRSKKLKSDGRGVLPAKLPAPPLTEDQALAQAEIKFSLGWTTEPPHDPPQDKLTPQQDTLTPQQRKAVERVEKMLFTSKEFANKPDDAYMKCTRGERKRKRNLYNDDYRGSSHNPNKKSRRKPRKA